MYFEFKQFKIRHDRCAMKVGTDGVLLGAWSDVERAGRVLDIGTGTGLVALMIAQRSPARIVALEIDAEAATQACENVTGSPWKERIEVVRQDFRTYTPSIKFDCIVCNPPFFENSLQCPAQQRTLARHTSELNYYELLEGVSKLLTDDGRFSIVIPTNVSTAVQELAETFGLYPYREMKVITAPGKQPKRTLLAFAFDPKAECRIEEMLVEVKRHQYSEEYIRLTKDYYLKM